MPDAMRHKIAPKKCRAWLNWWWTWCSNNPPNFSAPTATCIPALILFKYGKPRGYLQDFLIFHMKPHVYCALEPDSEQRMEYLKEDS